MSYHKLVKECEREGWLIPTTVELQGYDIEHELIWTASPVLETQYKLTEDDIKHGVEVGICYDYKKNKEYVINKSWTQHCAVLVKKE